MQLSRGEEEEEMGWAVPAALSGTQEKQLHKPDLENWATGKDSFDFGSNRSFPKLGKGVLQAGEKHETALLPYNR